MLYIADMAIWMSNFDIDQMPSKFTQSLYFVPYSYCKKIYMIGSLDNAENAKRNFFLTTLYLSEYWEN